MFINKIVGEFIIDESLLNIFNFGKEYCFRRRSKFCTVYQVFYNGRFVLGRAFTLVVDNTIVDGGRFFIWGGSEFVVVSLS